jgi:hypothetical protein
LHALSEEYGVNIYNKYKQVGNTTPVDFQFLGGAMLKVNSEDEAYKDDVQGTIPMRRWPYLNMCVNTLNSVKHQSEFISAIPYATYTVTKDTKLVEYFYGKTG